MDLEVRHLRLVNAIASEGSVTRAAAKLHLTQSALSHQLKDIEDRLDTNLFHRLKRKMVLTEAGNRILHSAEKVLRELEQTEESIRKLSNGEQGVLRIATQCNTCYHWLPSMMKLFQEQHPGIEIRIEVECTRQPVAALLDGKLDIAIAYSEVHNPSLSSLPLFEDELLAVMESDHPLAAKSYLEAEDFAEETLLVYAIPLESNFVFQKLFISSVVRPRKIYKMLLTEAMIEMIKAGMGIGLFAGWAVRPYLERGDLKGVRLTRRGIRRKWKAVMLQSAANRTHYRQFTRLLARESMPVSGKNGGHSHSL